MDFFMSELAWPAAVVFSGYVLLGLTGFGSALVIVPLLTWQWALPHVVALTLLLDLPAGLLHGGLNLRQVRWQEIRIMWPGLVLGSALGLWLVHVLDPHWPLLLLGLNILGVGLKQALGSAEAVPPLPAKAAMLAGSVGGLVEMMFGTAGPVLMVWLRRRLADVMQLRATAPLLIVSSACIVLGEMALAGKLSSPELWRHWIWLLGAALLGTVLGDRMARIVPGRMLARGMALLLVASGLSLLKSFFWA